MGVGTRFKKQIEVSGHGEQLLVRFVFLQTLAGCRAIAVSSGVFHQEVGGGTVTESDSSCITTAHMGASLSGVPGVPQQFQVADSPYCPTHLTVTVNILVVGASSNADAGLQVVSKTWHPRGCP